jgi:hypothetical protein
MSDVDTGYGAEDEYRPGIPLPRLHLPTGRLGRAWRRTFEGWAPDERTVGVLLVAVFLGGLAGRLLTVDLSWTAFWNALQPPAFVRPPNSDLVTAAATRLLTVPAEVLILAGAVMLALRRGGRGLAALGLAALLALDVVNVAPLFSHARGGVAVRSAIAALAGAVGAALPLAVLLWSRRWPAGARVGCEAPCAPSCSPGGPSPGRPSCSPPTATSCSTAPPCRPTRWSRSR